MPTCIAHAAALSLMLAAGAFAQPTKPPLTPPAKPSTPPPAGTPPVTPAPEQPAIDLGEDLADRVLKKSRPRSWVLSVDVRVNGFRYAQNVDGKLVPGQIALKFDTAAIVFPVLISSSLSRSDLADAQSLESELQFDGRTVPSSPQFQDGYAAGTRLARWEMRNMEGSNWLLKLKLPMTSSETEIDEALGARIPWPKDYPPLAKSTFQPQLFVDYLAKPEEKADNDKVIQKWISDRMKGRDLKSTPPMLLAKELFGEVVQFVQPSGHGRANNRAGAFEGLELVTAAEVARSPRQSEFAIHGFLAAVYRSAGIPARTVYAWDVSETKDKDKNFLERAGGSATLRSWVEFCLVNPRDNSEIWIPVDAVRQRKSGSRPPALNRAWRYFGSNPDGAYLMPFAFQPHPPTTVVAHAFPAFYGWLTTPSTQYADQSLKFSAVTAARSSETQNNPKRNNNPKNR